MFIKFALTFSDILYFTTSRGLFNTVVAFLLICELGGGNLVSATISFNCAQHSGYQRNKNCANGKLKALFDVIPLSSSTASSSSSLWLL